MRANNFFIISSANGTYESQELYVDQLQRITDNILNFEFYTTVADAQAGTNAVDPTTITGLLSISIKMTPNSIWQQVGGGQSMDLSDPEALVWQVGVPYQIQATTSGIAGAAYLKIIYDWSGAR